MPVWSRTGSRAAPGRYGGSVVPEHAAASLGRRIGALGLTVCLVAGTLVVGWLVWSVVEWRNGRTPSYRLLGLRVVRRSDGLPVGLGRSFLRSGVCCPVLVVPTVVVGAVVLLCFAFGASPPDGLFRQPRRAPWDVLTATDVRDERARPTVGPTAAFRPIDPVDLAGRTSTEVPQANGHALN